MIKQNLKWAFIFAAVIAVSILIILTRPSKSAKTANIIQDGNIIRTVDLQAADTPYEFDIAASDGGHNTIRVEKGKIGIISADCPDKICVKQGFIENGTLPIICLPHRLSVVISDDSTLDAVSGGR